MHAKLVLSSLLQTGHGRAPSIKSKNVLHGPFNLPLGQFVVSLLRNEVENSMQEKVEMPQEEERECGATFCRRHLATGPPLSVWFGSICYPRG